MNTEKKLALAALLVGLVALAFGLFGGGKTTEIIRETVRELVGATPGSDFPELTIGGVKFIAHRQDMLASNTPCALRVQSTSTLDLITVFHKGRFADAGTSNAVWTFSTSTARTATGTIFNSISVPNNAGLSFATRGYTPTSTPNGITNGTSTTVVLRPNDWVNVNVASPSFETTEILGSCNFQLIEL